MKRPKIFAAAEERTNHPELDQRFRKRRDYRGHCWPDQRIRALESIETKKQLSVAGPPGADPQKFLAARQLVEKAAPLFVRRRGGAAANQLMIAPGGRMR
jgi:hypothetical protein